MTTEFKLPELGENIESGDVVNVLVSEGDTISVDDPVLEIETDKATIEVPSSVSGVVKAIHVAAGDTIQVGQVILTAENGAEESASADLTETASTAVPDVEVEAQAEPEVVPAAPPETASTAVKTGVVGVPTIVDIKLPELGENIETGTVVGVLVSAGDTISEDQGVLELETDKATVEVPSPFAGQVTAIRVHEGDEVNIGQTILTVETTAAPALIRPVQLPEPAPEPEPVESEAARAEAIVPLPPSPATDRAVSPEELGLEWSPRPERGVLPAAPNVRRIAREIGVDISQVTGSGPGARISVADVKRHAREVRAAGPVAVGRPAAPPLPDFSRWGELERQPMSNIRRATAKQLDAAWSTIPHVTQFDKADVTDLEQLRKRFGRKVEEAGGKLTVTAILLKVVSAALKAFPKFNASIDMAQEEVILKQYYHIGVAVDTERGLLVPVIRDVDQKNIIELAVELGQVAERARLGKLGLDEMQGGTFTITNLGGIGGTNFTPIINMPEVAILGVARGRQEPVFNGQGQVEPRLMLPLALSYDHRLIDGADGARFLRWIVEYIEQPFLTALQGW
jgi:pyruvate dehydrogenase E2 component (dihydrolipoamide acetyltransferase)